MPRLPHLDLQHPTLPRPAKPAMLVLAKPYKPYHDPPGHACLGLRTLLDVEHAVPAVLLWTPFADADSKAGILEHIGDLLC